MKELIKATNKKETEILNELFDAVPKFKSPWTNLLNKLTKSTLNLNKLHDQLSFNNLKHQDNLELLNKEKTALIIQTKEINQENIDFLKTDFFEKQKKEKTFFFTEQSHIKNEIAKINNAHKNLSDSLDKKIITIENNLTEEFDEAKELLKSVKANYLTKVSSIYKYKETEATRITTKFNEQIEDYHQKNKQRLTQNTFKLQEEDKKLELYQQFHEKDGIYAKQNYFKTVTSINEKINVVTNNYKELEKQLEEDFLLQNKNLLNNLDAEKKQLETSNNEALNTYEKEYQKIDALLDELRENHHEQEDKLKTKYNRAVTSININLHNQKEELNNSITTLTKENPQNKKQINALFREIKLSENKAAKKIKQAQKEYKNAFFVEVEEFVTAYELALYNRTLAEQEKNDSFELYKTFCSLYENFINEKIKLYGNKNKLKKAIIDNYKQLEMKPLESQTELANHIYNLEINFQKLEDEYMYSSIFKEKHLANLKSNLHEYNLNKTKDRLQYNYNLELTTLNLTTYLQMESEKNDLVFENRLSIFKEKHKKSLTKIEILKVSQQKEISALQESQKINSFNYLLQSKIKLKGLNEDLLKATNNFLFQKENLTCLQRLREIDFDNYKSLVEEESLYLDGFLAYYNALILNLISAEKTIFETFNKSSANNANFDDYEILLSSVKEILLSRQELTKQLINIFFDFVEDYLETKIKEISAIKLVAYKNKTIETYDKPLKALEEKQKSFYKQLNLNNKNIKRVKKEIVFLNEQKNYSFEIIKSTQKDLLNLNPSNKNEKTIQTINSLNENLVINKSIVAESAQQITDLNKELKKLKAESGNLKKSTRLTKKKINKANKAKENSLLEITNSLKTETGIFWNILKSLKPLKEKITLNDESYKFIVTNIPLLQSVDKTKKTLSASLHKRHQLLQNVFLIIEKDKEFSLNKFIYQSKTNQEKQIIDNKNELEALKNTHLQSYSKINKEIKKLKKFDELSLKRIKQKDKKDLKSLKNVHLLKVNESENFAKNIYLEKTDYINNIKNMNKAFEINKNDLLSKEKETIKTAFRASLKENQNLIKQTNLNIKNLTSDMQLEKKKYYQQFTFFANNDKQERKKISKNINDSLVYYEKQISNLKASLPKISLEVKHRAAKKEREKSKIKRNIKRQSIIAKHKNKVRLSMIILTRKKELKRTFIEKN